MLLDAFTTYLASAFGCQRVVRLPLAGRPPDLARSLLLAANDAWTPAEAQQVLPALRAGLAQAPVALVVWPADPACPRPADLEHRLVGDGLQPAFVGLTPPRDAGPDQRRLLAILEPAGQPRPEPAPPGFRVVAVVPTYNEADVVEGTLRYLVEDGVQVYLIDNWSTDGTPEIAARVGRRLDGLLGLERFPPDGPSASYDLWRIMARVEEVALELDADWLILHDADERRRSPWPGVGLRDALYHVDRRGFTCVDHVTLTFWPTTGAPAYDGSRDLEDSLPYFELSDHPGHFHQRRAWKRRPGQRVSLAPSAGHDVQFPGRRVYPYRFLLKHYPIRSQAHGERKVLAERLPRWSAAERARGWHAQYDHLVERPSFVREASELERFDPRTFYTERLMERLSGVGVFREPPSWATPPVWSAGRPAAA